MIRLGRGLAAGLGIAAVLTACFPAASASRDILWQIVSECVEPAAPGYCSRCAWPIEGACATGGACTKTTEVWAETIEYVAIRDIKMCGCPAGFVHGLALPRQRVTGVEDPRRPPGIWSFAWEAARSRIAEQQDIALVVNPPDLRTQDQLHVHLVRLAPGARRGLAATSPARTTSLAEVWAIADRSAAAAGAASYGVLVAREDRGPGFIVAVDAASPEYRFTVAECR